MKRRAFIKALAGGIASVAIGMHVARGMPAVLADGYQYKTVSLGYTIVSEEIDEGMYGEIGERYAKALAKSMRQTAEEFIANKEYVASNVLERAFGRMDSGEGARRSVGVEGSPDRI